MEIKLWQYYLHLLSHLLLLFLVDYREYWTCLHNLKLVFILLTLDRSHANLFSISLSDKALFSLALARRLCYPSPPNQVYNPPTISSAVSIPCNSFLLSLQTYTSGGFYSQFLLKMCSFFSVWDQELDLSFRHLQRSSSASCGWWQTKEVGLLGCAQGHRSCLHTLVWSPGTTMPSAMSGWTVASLQSRSSVNFEGERNDLLLLWQWSPVLN